MDDSAIREQLFRVAGYRPATQTFDMTDGYIGFAFIGPLLSGIDATLHDKLNLLLNLNYPTGSSLSVSRWSSPDIEFDLQAMQDLRIACSNATLRELTAERVAFLRNATQQGIASAGGMRVVSGLSLISVQIPAGDLTHRDIAHQQAADLQQLVHQTLKSIGFNMTPMTAKLYTRVMNSMINRRDDASWRDGATLWYDEGNLICNQILDANADIEFERRAVRIDDWFVKTLHVKQFPSKFSFGTATRYLADMLGGTRGIRENAIVSMNIVFPDQETKKTRVEANRVHAQTQAETKIARLVSAYRERADDFNALSAGIAQGDKVVYAYLGMSVYGNSRAAAETAAMNARTYFGEFGIKLQEDAFIVGPLWINMLPLGFDPVGAPSLKRLRTFATRQAVALLPVFGAWRGTGTPLLTLIARDGQFMNFSPWDGSSYNMLVAGTTGSGKSFCVQEVVKQARSVGTKVRIVDVGYSYRKMCKLLGGFELTFGSDRAICFNPFTHVHDFAEAKDFLMSIVEVMAAPVQGFSELQRGAVSRIMDQVWAEKKNAMIVDDIAAACAAVDDARVRDIATQIYPWTTAGEFGTYVNGVNNLELDNDLIVLELEELKTRPTLQRIVLMILMAQITQDFFRGDQSQKGLFVIDEAWQMLLGDGNSNRDGSSDTTAVIKAAYRRIRKANGSIVLVTQDLQDVWNTPGGNAIIANTEHMLILNQRADVITQLESERRLTISEYGYALLRSLVSEPGKYSEILVRSGTAVGVGRLVVSRFEQLLQSTTPAERARLDQLQRQGLSLREAIEQIIRDEARARAA